MWRFAEAMFPTLFRHTQELKPSGGKTDNLESQLMEAYNIGIRRGLTPHDALEVAAALGNANRRGYRAPGLAKRVHQARSH